MLEIVIISGKGGTGKTSLTASFAHLAQNKILCDLDVDAPDLHLILKPDHARTEDFYSGNEAIINQDLCDECGTCRDLCRFDAITQDENGFSVNPLKCEGCKVCVHFCPAGAIDFPVKHCGQWYISDTRNGPMVHAQLFPGEENSGRLVSLLRQHAREIAEKKGQELILCDGAPGIGCPVISSLAGTDLAVLVTEPTVSGRSDLTRVAELCGHFSIPAGVIINKCDINPEESERIKEYCSKNGLKVLAELPHDPNMTRAMVEGKAITEYTGDGLARDISRTWDAIMDLAREAKAA